MPKVTYHLDPATKLEHPIDKTRARCPHCNQPHEMSFIRANVCKTQLEAEQRAEEEFVRNEMGIWSHYKTLQVVWLLGFIVVMAQILPAASDWLYIAIILVGPTGFLAIISLAGRKRTLAIKRYRSSNQIYGQYVALLKSRFISPRSI